MSSWGIRMELLQIAMRTPCHQGEGSLHLEHTDGPPCDAWHSSFHLGKNSVRPTFHLLQISYIRNSVQPMFHLLWISYIRNSVRPTFHLLRIFHIRRLTSDGRGGRINFPVQTCPDPLIALTRRVFLSIYSATEFLLKLPDIFDRLFEIFCFRYLMSKSPNSLCNPPIIGFLSH